MGGSESKKPVAKKPDMTEVLIQMKMKAKTFSRQAVKSLKEKDKYYKLAKEQLKKGNEEGAQMYMGLVSQKQAEHMQFLRLSGRLEVIQVQIRSKMNSVDMVNELNMITPILQQNAEEMPIEEMYRKLESFGTSFDDLQIKGQILDDGMEKTLGEKGGIKNVEDMMQGLKAEVNMEMGINPVMENTTPAQQTKIQEPANNDFYADLKNI